MEDLRSFDIYAEEDENWDKEVESFKEYDPDDIDLVEELFI